MPVPRAVYGLTPAVDYAWCKRGFVGQVSAWSVRDPMLNLKLEYGAFATKEEAMRRAVEKWNTL